MLRFYTKKKHIKGVLKILETNVPCSRCPAQEMIPPKNQNIIFLRQYYWNDACKICKKFSYIPEDILMCPCNFWGAKNNIEMATGKLKKMRKL